MSDTLIENLFADGDVPSGQFNRVLGGLDANGKVRHTRSGYNGALSIRPGISSRSLLQLRSANPTCVYEGKSLYAKDTLFWNESTTGSGTSTFNTNGIVRLSCTATNGDQAIRQSKPYVPCQSGRNLLCLLGGVMGAIKANTRQRIGYFDANNGYFFEQNGTSLRVVYRTNISGSPVDTAVAQASWNIDPLDGTGTSGVTIDMSKFQIFVIDLTWGEPARLGVIVAGEVIYAHRFANANSGTSIGLTTPCLPLRFELTNTAATAGTTNLDVGWASAFSEGGFDQLGLVTAADNGTTARSISAGTSLPVLSVRLKSAYTRGILIPLHFHIFQTTAHNQYFKIVIGGTLTGGSFSSVSTAAEANITATALSGGTIIRSGYVVSGSAPSFSDSLDIGLYASADFAGTADIITIFLTDMAGSQSSSVTTSLSWREVI